MTHGDKDPQHRRSARAGLLVLGLLASAWACADSATGPPEEVRPPLTGLEARGGVGFTTHDEELTFLAQVEARSTRARITQVGMSVEGRPMHLVRVAHPQPAADGVIAAGRAVLVVGAQHGNEPAGREAALQLLRDLAFTDEGELLDVLTAATVLFIPTANPDGRVADTRRNADQVDINRDHMDLVSPEARTVAQVVRDFQPDLVVDAHERPGATTPDVQLLWPRNLNVYGPVRDLSRELVEEHLFDELGAGGRSVALYGPAPGPPGDENEAILRNAVGLRHALGLLVESAGGRAPVERVAVHVETLRSVLGFFGDRSSEIVTAVTAAPEAKAAAGRDRSEPFYLFGADNQAPTPDQILDPPPCAYVLSAGQAATLQPQITLLPLRIEPAAGSDVFLPMDQPMMTVVPLLVDGRARSPTVAAVPLVSDMECPALEE